MKISSKGGLRHFDRDPITYGLRRVYSSAVFYRYIQDTTSSSHERPDLE